MSSLRWSAVYFSKKGLLVKGCSTASSSSFRSPLHGAEGAHAHRSMPLFQRCKQSHSCESSHGHPSNLNIFSREISERLCQDDIILCVSEAFSPFKDGKVSKWRQWHLITEVLCFYSSFRSHRVISKVDHCCCSATICFYNEIAKAWKLKVEKKLKLPYLKGKKRWN